MIHETSSLKIDYMSEAVRSLRKFRKDHQIEILATITALAADYSLATEDKAVSLVPKAGGLWQYKERKRLGGAELFFRIYHKAVDNSLRIYDIYDKGKDKGKTQSRRIQSATRRMRIDLRDRRG